MDKSMVRVLFLITLTISCIFAVHLADASNSEWVEKATMPTGRYNFGAAVVNGTIYAIGGITNIPERKSGHITTTINVNEAYDPANDVWVEKTPMPSPHWLDSYGIAVWQNRIYCIGGPANNVYDPATDTWEAKAPMPTSRQWLTANVVDDEIYLIGGLAFGPAPAWQAALTNDPLTKLVTYSSSSLNEVYDPVTDSWSEKSPIPYAVDSYASAVVDNKIYVIGGRIGGDVVGFVQVYDPQTDEWSQAASVPVPVEAAAAGVMTISNVKAVCIVGGSTTFAGCDATNLNQIYFPENNTWTTGSPMTTSITSLSVAVADDKLYAIGGFGYHGYVATTYQYTLAEPTETNLTTSLPQSSSTLNENQNNPIITTEISIAATTLLGTATVSAVTIRLKRKAKT
jgi:N-acetylneuraminic acid mutarotase